MFVFHVHGNFFLTFTWLYQCSIRIRSSLFQYTSTNTNQLECNTSGHKSTRVQHELARISTSPTRINGEFWQLMKKVISMLLKRRLHRKQWTLTDFYLNISRAIEKRTKCFCISSDIQYVTKIQNRIGCISLVYCLDHPKHFFFHFSEKCTTALAVKSSFLVLRLTNNYIWYIFF